jgi:hypothetical protein
MSEEKGKREVVFEESTREISLGLPNGNSFEIKAKKLIKIVKTNSDQDEGFLDALWEGCPSTEKFIELFVMLGAHALLAEIFMKGPK